MNNPNQIVTGRSARIIRQELDNKRRELAKVCFSAEREIITGDPFLGLYRTMSMAAESAAARLVDDIILLMAELKGADPRIILKAWNLGINPPTREANTLENIRHEAAWDRTLSGFGNSFPLLYERTVAGVTVGDSYSYFPTL